MVCDLSAIERQVDLWRQELPCVTPFYGEITNLFFSLLYKTSSLVYCYCKPTLIELTRGSKMVLSLGRGRCTLRTEVEAIR